MSFYYLASPYSKYPSGLQVALQVACTAASALIEKRVPVFCPIAHSHPISAYNGLDPLDHALWMAVDAPFMAAAKGLIVLRAQGWQDSEGVAIEVDAFMAAGKPIVYMLPYSVPDVLLGELR